MREIAPGDAGAVHVQDGVHDLAQVVCGRAADGQCVGAALVPPGRHDGLDQVPAGVRQVAGIGAVQSHVCEVADCGRPRQRSKGGARGRVGNSGFPPVQSRGRNRGYVGRTVVPDPTRFPLRCPTRRDSCHGQLTVSVAPCRTTRRRDQLMAKIRRIRPVPVRWLSRSGVPPARGRVVYAVRGQSPSAALAPPRQDRRQVTEPANGVLRHR